MSIEEIQKLCAEVQSIFYRLQVPIPYAIAVLDMVKFKMLRDAYERKNEPKRN